MLEETEFGVTNVAPFNQGVLESTGLEGGDQLILAVVHNEEGSLQVVNVLTGGDAQGLGQSLGWHSSDVIVNFVS